MKKQLLPTHSEGVVRIVELVSLVPRENKLRKDICIWSGLAAVMFPKDMFSVAKQFWQHNGGGVSSRRAEFCRQELEEGLLAENNTIDGASKRATKGPRRYSRQAKEKSTIQSQPGALANGQDPSRFVEERFGRNLDLAFVDGAKLAIRRRIAGTLRSNVGLKEAINLSNEGGRPVEGFTEDDVFLFPTGMNAIFNSHRILMAARGPKKSVCYGYALFGNSL
jgi:cystathionine gamma-synthase